MSLFGRGMMLAAAAMGAAIGIGADRPAAEPPPPTRARRRRPAPIRWNWGWRRTYAPNGERECDRRMRQIARGQLREQNGLVR